MNYIHFKLIKSIQCVFNNYYFCFLFRTPHAKKICETVVVNQLDEIEKEPEMVVREAAVSLLIHMIITQQSQVVEKMLTSVEKVIFILRFNLTIQPFLPSIGEEGRVGSLRH